MRHPARPGPPSPARFTSVQGRTIAEFVPDLGVRRSRSKP